MAIQYGLIFFLICQPPNFLNLNVLDLRVFRTVQSLKYKDVSKTIYEFISVVVKAYEYFPFLNSEVQLYLYKLQSCMIEIMQAKGSHK